MNAMKKRTTVFTLCTAGSAPDELARADPSPKGHSPRLRPYALTQRNAFPSLAVNWPPRFFPEVSMTTQLTTRRLTVCCASRHGNAHAAAVSGQPYALAAIVSPKNR